MSLCSTGMSPCSTGMSLCSTGMSPCSTGMSLSLDIPEEVVPKDEGQADTWKSDIVGAYADRLAAVTHAFSLCSNAILKSIGK